MAEDPLLTKTIRCPACEQQVPLRIANPRLYTVASRESDRHVTGYRWLHGIVTNVQPHHYQVWQCANCLFADLTETIDRPEPDPYQEGLRRAFRDISIEKRMVLDTLRALVPSGDLEPKGAIAIHLAALLIATLPTGERQVDHSKLGRIALRLAWLFREMGAAGGADAPAAESQAMVALAEATERMEQLLVDAGDTLGEIQRQGQLRTQELRLPGTAEANPYLALGDMIEVRLKALQGEVNTLQMAVLQDQQGRMAPVAAPVQEGSGDLIKSLIALAPLWPKLPRSERQSLRVALEAFEFSYQFEGDGEAVDQGVAQVNLILDILVRLGELERALEWTTQISKYASDTATDLKGRLEKARANHTLSTFDNTVIHRKIAALGLTQQKAGERRRDILTLMLARDREKIDAVLERTAQLPAKERLQAVTEAGIHDGVVALLSREVEASPKGGSGGWFKGLF